MSAARSTETPAERFVVFECQGERCLGVVTEGTASTPRTDVGLVIVVGGPQYRVGSHRQFVLLARRLAHSGIPVLRFDYRGMGDSGGAMQSFEETRDDLGAALKAFEQACPQVRRIVLWGLCDGASAALAYWEQSRDPRIAAMTLLNPWVRSEATLAKTHVKHYYGRRALERAFWVKALTGRVDFKGALKSIVLGLTPGAKPVHWVPTFHDRITTSLIQFTGPMLILLSERDITAKEFLEYVRSSKRLRNVFQRPNVQTEEIAGADHTFSSSQWRGAVESRTLIWLTSSVAAAPVEPLGNMAA